MTFLEVHTDEKVHRWWIGHLPEGRGEEGYRQRMKWINDFLREVYQQNMEYALEGAKIYIVHESKMNHGTPKIHGRAGKRGKKAAC